MCGGWNNLISTRAAGQYMSICQPCESARHDHDREMAFSENWQFYPATGPQRWPHLRDTDVCEWCGSVEVAGTVYHFRYHPICAACAAAEGFSPRRSPGWRGEDRKLQG
jgi:hypothetical protein